MVFATIPASFLCFVFLNALFLSLTFTGKLNIILLGIIFKRSEPNAKKKYDSTSAGHCCRTLLG